MLRKILFYLLGMCTIGASNALLMYVNHQISGTPDNKHLQITVPELTLKVQNSDSLDADAWDEVLRTSDLEGENSSSSKNYNRTKVKSENKEQLERVGCICMDEIMELRKAQGACSGHGGVRYWLYRNADGSVMRKAVDKSSKELVPRSNPGKKIPSNSTKRGGDEAIKTADEKNVSQPANISENEIKTTQRTSYLGFYDMITMLFVCITVVYVTKILFVRA
jgi:hypothetical protein